MYLVLCDLSYVALSTMGTGRFVLLVGVGVEWSEVEIKFEACTCRQLLADWTKATTSFTPPHESRGEFYILFSGCD